MSTPTSSAIAAKPRLAASRSDTWRTGLLSIAVALLANLLVLGLARLAGADMQVRPDPTVAAMTIGIGLVAVSTVLPMLLATVALLALRRWGPRAWHALAWTGLAVGLATVPVPFTMVSEADTQAALALMHVVTGLSWLVVVRRSARAREDG